MNIAIIGCGAIGGLFLGYLKQEGSQPVGVVKGYQKEAIDKQGLLIEGVKGDFLIRNIRLSEKLTQRVDLAVLGAKTGDLKEMLTENFEYLKGAALLSVQNGVRAERIIRNYFPEEKIISGIVMFGATFYPPRRIVHNFEGELVLGNLFNRRVENLEGITQVLSRIFKVFISEDIKGAKYLKIFINLHNCIPACLGVSMQEAFSDLGVSKVAIRLTKEAYSVIADSDIRLEDLPSYPKSRLESLTSADLEKAAVIFSGIMTSLSKYPIYGSILQSINRQKPSEIDYINGEIVSLARENKTEAPLNKRITELVHGVERGRSFLSKQEFLREFGSN